MGESKHAGKTPRIIELRQSGKTWKEISKEVDIPQRSLYNLRDSEGFVSVVEGIWLDLWVDIAKQRKIDTHYNLDQGIKNQMKMLMLLTGTNLDRILERPKPVDSIASEIDITEKRKKKDKMLREMELTPKQNRVLEKYVESETEYNGVME